MIQLQLQRKPKALTRHVLCIIGFSYNEALGWHASKDNRAAQGFSEFASISWPSGSPDEQIEQAAQCVAEAVREGQEENAGEWESAPESKE